MTQAQRIARFVEYGFLAAGLAFAGLLMPPQARAGIGIGMVLVGIAQMALAPPTARHIRGKRVFDAKSQAWMAGGAKGTTRYLTAIGGILVAGGVVFILSCIVG